MEKKSTLLAIYAGNSPVPGEFPTKRPVTRSFDVYFGLRPNKRLSEQSWGWWFEMPSHPLWRHRNGMIQYKQFICVRLICKIIKTEYGIYASLSLQWHHNGRDGVSHHQSLDCLLNRTFVCRPKTTSKLRVTGLCAGEYPVNSPHKRPVTRKMFPFDDIIMICAIINSDDDLSPLTSAATSHLPKQCYLAV